MSAENIYPYAYLQPKNCLSFSEVRRVLMPFRFDLAAKEIVRELKIKPNDKILELGCGIGLLANSIIKTANLSLEYFGLDLYKNSAMATYKNGVNSTQADLIFLPFPNKSFDHLISTDVLEHVQDADSAISEISRVLKTEGKAFIVIADPSEGRFANVYDHIKRSNKSGSDRDFWEEKFSKHNLLVLPQSEKYRKADWRRLFNLPILCELKNTPGLACAFNPVYRPGTYIIKKL